MTEVTFDELVKDMCENEQKDDKILVAGATGMVGSAIVRNLKAKGYTNILILLIERELIIQISIIHISIWIVLDLIMSFLELARVGGIMDNATHAADYIRDNLRIQTNLIDSSYKKLLSRQRIHKKLLFLGSSCIYPKHANQPMTEDQLLSGYLEPTNQSYALAKIEWHSDVSVIS